MRQLVVKILICAVASATCCMSCTAGSAPSARVKTTKKTVKQEVAKPEKVDNNQVQIVAVKSAKMGRDINNVIVVPKEAAEDNSAKFPVVYLLHGYDGCHLDWNNHVDLAALANKYGMIFVCPDGQNNWYLDSPIDPRSQYETYVTQELRNYVEDNYPTINDVEHRAITGLSMGGHGALWLGWRHPEIYGSCGSMSGAVDISTIKKGGFGIDKLVKYEDRKAYSVINLVPNLKEGQQNIIIDDGTSDFLIKENRALHAALLKHGITHNYSERPGRHTWKYWVESLNYHLDFFAQHFKY